MAKETLDQLRTAYVVAERDFAQAWLEAYDEYKNVSYAERRATVSDAGQTYLTAKLKYEEAVRIRANGTAPSEE